MPWIFWLLGWGSREIWAKGNWDSLSLVDPAKSHPRPTLSNGNAGFYFSWKLPIWVYSTIMLFIVLMYRHTKEKFCRIYANTIENLNHAVIFATRSRSFAPCLYHLITSSISPSLFLHSVMSTSITPVAHKLESADHLSHCEETQELCHNNTSGDYIGSVHGVSELLDAVWSLGDSWAGVPCGLE